MDPDVLSSALGPLGTIKRKGAREFTAFLTHNIEQRVALKNGMGEAFGFRGDTSVKTVEPESVK